MTKHKYFNGKKYLLNQGYYKRTTRPEIFLSHDIWNFYHPEDTIKEGEAIHHINENKSDDRIENLQKMTRSEHNTLHKIGKSINKGNNNPRYKGGIKFKQLYLGGKIIEGQGHLIMQTTNSLGEVLGSGFTFRYEEK